jgi:integrase
MRLNETIIRNTKPSPKLRKLSDGDGLYLFVQPNGARWWRMRYFVDGVEKMLSVGVYPEVSLKDARQRREEIRRQVASKVDPSEGRKAEKRARAHTFESVAREWWGKRRKLWSETYANAVMTRFEQDIFPFIGKKPVKTLAAADFLECLERMQERGVLESAHKVKTKCSEVMRFAVATRRAERDPVVDLKGALPPVKHKHYASITYPSEVGALLRVIDGYHGKSRVVECALRLLPLVFVRSSELRYATWGEFELDDAQWKIPAERMKMRNPHIVPLSKQAVAILRELHHYTGPDGYIFPSVRTFAQPISENTINAALRRMGYTKDEMTGHGFRSMASTLLNEQGWHPDAIERQLAHCEEDDVRAAYNYAEYLPERRRMMQAWADYLDGLRAATSVNTAKLAAAMHGRVRTGASVPAQREAAIAQARDLTLHVEGARSVVSQASSRQRYRS